MISIFLVVHNYITNGIIHNYSFNTFSNFIQYFLFVKFYLFCFKPQGNKDKVIDLILLHCTLIVIAVTLCYYGLARYYPDAFPFLFIFCSAAIFIGYLNIKYQYIIFLCMTMFALMVGRYVISPYYFNQNQLKSNISINGTTFREAEFYNIDSQIIVFSPAKYKVSILKFSYMACLPCHELEPVFEDACAKYIDNNHVFIGKINPLDNISYMKSTIKNKYLKNMYSDLYMGNSINIFHVDKYPVTIILDCNGHAVYRFEGYNNGFKEIYKNQITQIVDSLINKQ